MYLHRYTLRTDMHVSTLSANGPLTPHKNPVIHFYSARNARIASAVLATAIPSVRLSVHLSHAGIVSKRRNVARCSLHRWIAKCV